MEKELFIYKIATNRDWYLLFNSEKLELYNPIIDCYETFNMRCLSNLEEYSTNVFEALKSSISKKEKLIHCIITWYCTYNDGAFIMNDEDEVYFITNLKLDDVDLEPLSDYETDAILNEILYKYNLAIEFDKVQKYYLEHEEEITKKIKDFAKALEELGIDPMNYNDMRLCGTTETNKTEDE